MATACKGNFEEITRTCVNLAYAESDEKSCLQQSCKQTVCFVHIQLQWLQLGNFQGVCGYVCKCAA